MARPGRMRFAPKHRDKLRENNAADRGYAAMYGKEPAFQSEIKPVRAYTKREGTQRESVVLDSVRQSVKRMPNVTLYRNSQGAVQLPQGMLRYGVGPNGASDLIGYVTLTVTPAMVGREVAVFAALEVKAPGKNATPEQAAFIDRIIEAGGVAGVATNANEARRILDGLPSPLD